MSQLVVVIFCHNHKFMVVSYKMWNCSKIKNNNFSETSWNLF